MARLPRTRPDRLWPLGLTLLACAACTPTRRVSVGPPPEPCTDSVAARVARLPAESVTVADREHALWAQQQCKVALDSQSRAARQPAAAPTDGAQGPAHAAGAAATQTWPPPACKDSIAARVARMPSDSVSAADRQHAAAARLECERALAAPPPAPSNAASRNQAAVWLIGGALIVVMMLFL